MERMWVIQTHLYSVYVSGKDEVQKYASEKGQKLTGQQVCFSGEKKNKLKFQRKQQQHKGHKNHQAS